MPWDIQVHVLYSMGIYIQGHTKWWFSKGILPPNPLNSRVGGITIRYPVLCLFSFVSCSSNCRVDFYAHIVSYLPDEYPRFYAFQSTYAKHCRLPNGCCFNDCNPVSVSSIAFPPDCMPRFYSVLWGTRNAQQKTMTSKSMVIQDRILFMQFV